MKDGFRVMDSDLHVIEMEDVYEKHFTGGDRERRPKYLGWSPTNFPHWEVAGRMIPPWAVADDVIGPQKFLDSPSEATYEPVRERGYDAPSTPVLYLRHMIPIRRPDLFTRLARISQTP